MYKLVLFSLAVVSIFSSGAATECYTGQYSINEKSLHLSSEECKANEKCVTLRTETPNWATGGDSITFTKSCSPDNTVCEKKYREQTEWEAKYKANMADYFSSKFYCSYCNSDLCNDVSHGQKKLDPLKHHPVVDYSSCSNGFCGDYIIWQPGHTHQHTHDHTHQPCTTCGGYEEYQTWTFY